MEKLILLLSVIFLVVSVSAIKASIIHVPADSTTIQAGINGAVNGDTVMISPGTYYEHDLDFIGKAITVMSTDPFDPLVIASTIIDANNLGGVFNFHSFEDTTSVLAGLKITNGNDGSSGGINIESSSPTISNCWITENTATTGAGGVYCNEAAPKFSGCLISKNSGNNAGGIQCYFSSPRIYGCYLVNNSSFAGGGISVAGSSSPYIENTLIVDNSTAVWGGGAFFDVDCSPTLVNCNISRNTSNNFGGGVYCGGNPNALFVNCTIMENTAPEGGGLYLIYCTTPTLINCLIAKHFRGGIHCENTDDATIINTTIVNNSAEIYGGIYCYRSNIIIT